MPTYDVSVHCKDCGHDHPVRLSIYVKDGPDHRQSIAESFHGRSLPPQVATIRWLNALCYKTGRKFRLENEDETFLVPLSYFKSPFSHSIRLEATYCYYKQSFTCSAKVGA
jgi:hypothetical protein